MENYEFQFGINIHESVIFLLLVTIVDKSKLKIWKGAGFFLHIKLLKKIHTWLQSMPTADP